MSESGDLESVSSLSEVSNRVGVGRYLWLYFFVVPLAAVSASTVAIVITALQGLETNPEAPRLYSLIVIIGLKLIASIASAYLIAVLLALLSVYLVKRTQERDDERANIITNTRSELVAEYSNLARKSAHEFVGGNEERDDEMSEIASKIQELEKASNQKMSLQSKSRDQVMIGASLFYGMIGLLTVVYLYIFDDLRQAWHILYSIAKFAIPGA